MRPLLLQGNEACVRGALDAGLRFFSGYPITPSTEIAELLSFHLPKRKGVFLQMEDEIAGMAAAVGASLAGLKSMTATSGPGFSLKQENLGFAAMAEIPCVVVNVQRVGPSTGMATSPAQGDVMQARWGTHGDHGIVCFSPSTVLETYSLTVKAFNVAEKYRTPVILLLDEIVAHLREKVVLPSDLEVSERERPGAYEGYLPYSLKTQVPPLARFGQGYRFHVTGLSHGEDGFPTQDPSMAEKQLLRKVGKIEDHVEELSQTDAFCLGDADLVIVSFGGAARSGKEAVRLARSEGIKAGLLRYVTIWPFDETPLLELKSKGVKAVIVLEMNLGQMILPVKRVMGDSCKVMGFNKVAGQLIDPNDVLTFLREVSFS